MNYYPFHVGDYIAHTAHLDPIEDLAYRRLLDAYYITEGPIEGTPEQIARLIRLRSHVDVVAAVLAEFFDGSEPGRWRHARCEVEITKFHAMRDGGRKGAANRWRQAGDKAHDRGGMGGALAGSSPPHGPPNANQNQNQNQEEQQLPVQETLPRAEQISSCAEPPKTAARAPAAAEDIACEMPAVGGKTAVVTKAQVREWAAAYPGIDVMAELAKARAWLISNPSRGKTPRGMPRYLNAWLARAQDDLGKTHGHADRPRGRYGGTPTLPERQKAAMADFLAREARLVNPNGGTPHARDGDRPVLGADDRDLRTPLVIDLRPRA